MTNETMRAQVIEGFGGPEALVERRMPVEQPRDGEVLVRVAAAGLNPVDWKTRAGGGVSAWCQTPMPWILGWDFAGSIVALGAGVSSLRVGDEVFGLLQLPGDARGAYAEYVRVPAKDVVTKPRSIDMVHAAALPLAALTAWQALFDVTRIRDGEHVLIHGASGGVGHLAVQLARDAGAHVIAVTSTSNAEFVRNLGASEVIDRTRTSFEDAIRKKRVDVVLDTLGGATLTRSLAALDARSRIVTLPSPAPDTLTHNGEKIPWFLVQPHAEQLREIAKRVDEGKLRVHIAKAFPLAQAAAAHAYAETNPIKGKLVLDMRG